MGLIWRGEASLDALAEPGALDEKTGSFPSALSLPERGPELRAEFGPEL